MTKPRRGPRTAAEITAELEADPEYQARKRERDRKHEERVAKLRADQAPLLADLRAVGIDVETVWDLVNGPHDYQAAYPLGKLMDESVLPEALELAADPDHGESRDFLVLQLGHYNDREDVR